MPKDKKKKCEKHFGKQRKPYHNLQKVYAGVIKRRQHVDDVVIYNMIDVEIILRLDNPIKPLEFSRV